MEDRQMDPTSVIELGIVGTILGFVLKWMMGRFSKELDRIASGLLVNSAAIIAMQKTLVIHDHFGTEVSDQIALKKYEEILTSLDALQAQVLKTSETFRDTAK